jgi:DNA-binding NarL/FixJ family response regulator
MEIAAVEQYLASARTGMVCLAIEGEPGIGKTRLLLAIEELARAHDFTAIGVTADEEIRGPLLLARSIFASPAVLETAGPGSEEAVQRVVEALSSNEASGLESLAPDRRVLRIFDLAAMALRSLAAERPLALLVDDVQWADEDSLRLLRYVTRVDATSPILLVLASRPDEVAFVDEAVTLMADMDRMGLLRRMKLGRFGQLESAEFLQQVLGGQINLSSAAIMHTQAEGVPFILAEQARAYRDSGLIQQIDGVWTLARNAERLLPSAVRTLIQRRAAHLPEETKSTLAEAAVLGRAFSMQDLREVKTRLGDPADNSDSLAESLAPAVSAGLLVQHPLGSAADYSFTHDQIREYVTATALTASRRRAIHGAIVDMLSSNGEPSPGSLPLLAQHALASGRTELCARFSIEAGRAALAAHAPDEALRLVDIAHQVATAAKDRVELLRLRDDALAMLRRPAQRIESLAELAALGEALGDSRLELEVMLRRAAAWRLSQDEDRAAELARRARELAQERGDPHSELAACLELGQDLLGTELGEGIVPASSESDFDGAQEAYERAVALAEQLTDEANLAAATRELGVIALSRLRAWFVERFARGEHLEYMRQLAAGQALSDVLAGLPEEAASVHGQAGALFQKALELYDKLGDRQGAMSTIIAMSFLSWGPEIHLPGSAHRIEEIRRLSTRFNSLTKESERALADAQMLYGAHVYARAKVFPDLAVSKGIEAHAAARSLGDRALEFAAAGGTALAFAGIEAVEEAQSWLDRAAVVASAEPTAYRARQLALWRGAVCAAAADATGMRSHLERAVELATDQGRPAPRCEALARLALDASCLGSRAGDEGLLALAERSAGEAKALGPILPGRPPWTAQADAALARVHLARGAPSEAVAAARSALAELRGAMHEDLQLDALLPAADAVIQGGEEQEAREVREWLRMILSFITQRIVDEDVRARWFRSSTGRELVRLAGPIEATPAPSSPASSPQIELDERDAGLLRLLVEGRTNSEIAKELGQAEEDIAKKLSELYIRIGVSSRAHATTVALLGGLI